MELSMEEARLIGMELRKTVNTQAFAKCIEALRYQYQSQLFATEATEQSRREVLYYEAKALEELLLTFDTFISVADADALETEEPQIFE